MKYLKIMGLCLVAMAALALSVVASASALETKEPELRAKGGGAIVKNKFTGKGTSTEYVLETEKNGSIKCTALKATGKVNSAREAESTVTFTGCTAFAIAKCNSAGAKEGEIVTTISIKPDGPRAGSVQ